MNKQWRLRAPSLILLLGTQVAADLIGMGIQLLRHKDPSDGSQTGLMLWCILMLIYVPMLGWTLTMIPLNVANRMVRIGLGKHDGNWFLRVDLWWAGFRLTR